MHRSNWNRAYRYDWKYRNYRVHRTDWYGSNWNHWCDRYNWYNGCNRNDG